MIEMKVPFADVAAMHEEIRDELDQAYKRVVDSAWFIQGNECKAFEQEYAEYVGTKYCVGVGTGLDAIFLILRALGIGPGDKVIVPSNTFIATALAVSYTGAVPVLVEPDLDTYNISPEKIEEKIDSNTKAIIPVHLQGRPADMDEVQKIADKYKLYVIEDAAQSHGSHYKGRMTGNLSDAAAFSFYPGKNLGALGDGGCITTNNKDIADKVRALGNYGSDYKYHHVYRGTNSRLDEMQASFLRVKLKYLDKWNRERRRIASRYLNEINNPLIALPFKSDGIFEHIYHVFVIRCRERDRLEKWLNKRGIGTVKHYPVPIHKQEAYNEMNAMHFPVAEEISSTVISIPMYYGISDDQIQFVIDTINEFK